MLFFVMARVHRIPGHVSFLVLERETGFRDLRADLHAACTTPRRAQLRFELPESRNHG